MSQRIEPTLVHVCRLDVRWGDLDALGHVNNSRYFTYFEQARVDWMRTRGLAIRTDQGPVLARTSCDFRLPVIYPNTITVEVFVDVPGRSSFETTYRVLGRDGELVAEGAATVVWFDFGARRPTRLPEEIRELLTTPFRP